MADEQDDAAAAFEALNATLKRMFKMPQKPRGNMKVGKIEKREPGKPNSRRGSNEKAEEPNNRP